MTGKGKTGFAGKRNHGLVGAQGIAEQARRAESCGAALQIAQQRRTDTLALPAVIDRQAELETIDIVVKSIAGFADDGLDAIDRHGRNHAKPVRLADMDEVLQYGLRQLADRAQEAVVAGAGCERAEVVLEQLRIARLDKAHRDGLAVAQPQDVRMLPQIVEAKRGHGWAPVVWKHCRRRQLAAPAMGWTQARQNGFSASRTTSLQDRPTSCSSRSVQRASSRRCR